MPKQTASNFKSTVFACYRGYITQGIVNNLSPLFFVIYQTHFHISYGLISALIASAIVCGGYYAVYEWYGKNPTNLTAMFGGTLLPLQDLWYYVVLGFMLFGFVLCGIGTATSIRKHLQV